MDKVYKDIYVYDNNKEVITFFRGVTGQIVVNPRTIEARDPKTMERVIIVLPFDTNGISVEIN